MSSESFRTQLNQFLASEYNRLVAFTRSLVSGDEYGAEDFVQDVVANLFERADIITPVENLSGYVYQSLRNRVIDFFRKKKIGMVSLDQPIRASENLTLADLITESLSGRTTPDQDRIADRLFKMLDTLDEHERGLIIATDIENRSYQSLSEQFGIPVNTLLSQKHRALNKLRKRFGGDDNY